MRRRLAEKGRTLKVEESANQQGQFLPALISAGERLVGNQEFCVWTVKGDRVNEGVLAVDVAFLDMADPLKKALDVWQGNLEIDGKSINLFSGGEAPDHNPGNEPLRVFHDGHDNIFLNLARIMDNGWPSVDLAVQLADINCGAITRDRR